MHRLLSLCVGSVWWPFRGLLQRWDQNTFGCARRGADGLGAATLAPVLAPTPWYAEVESRRAFMARLLQVMISPGALMVSPGALMVSPGALRVSPGALMASPGALMVSPGARCM